MRFGILNALARMFRSIAHDVGALPLSVAATPITIPVPRRPTRPIPALEYKSTLAGMTCRKQCDSGSTIVFRQVNLKRKSSCFDEDVDEVRPAKRICMWDLFQPTAHISHKQEQSYRCSCRYCYRPFCIPQKEGYN